MTESRRGVLFCCAWIGSCLLAGCLLWFFTQSARTNFLLRSANRVIARSGDSRRLLAADGRAGELGTWFTLVEVPENRAAGGRALVFTLMDGTRAASCAAIVGADKKVEKIIPLSAYAEMVLEKLPEPVYRLYVERITAMTGRKR